MTEEKLELGNKSVRNHTFAAVGVGLIPVPMVDLVGIAGVQLDMLRKLAKIYEVPFVEHKAKTILTALIGGSGTLPVASAFGSLIKVVPIIGQTIGSVSMSISAGAVTYAVGKVFLMHFASGGTFLSFNPESVKEYYAEMFKEGKLVAEGARA